MGSLRSTIFAIIACWLIAFAAFGQQRLSFDIPAQPAADAIKSLAQQSGLQVAARPADLSGIQTNRVRGTYAPLDALRLLIRGTGLEISVTQADSVTIHRVKNVPAPALVEPAVHSPL